MNGETEVAANDEFGEYMFRSQPYRELIESSMHKTRGMSMSVASECHGREQNYLGKMSKSSIS